MYVTNMTTIRSNLSKIIITKKEKRHKAKRKAKKDFLEFQPFNQCFSKGVKPFFDNNVHSFWKYSPINPFSLQTFKESDSRKCTTATTSIDNQSWTPSSFDAVSLSDMSSIVFRRENDNTTAVIEARREIEKIKTELETLINSNIKAQVAETESEKSIPLEIPEIETLLCTAADACNTLADVPETIEPVIVKPNSGPKPVIKTSAASPLPNRKKVVSHLVVEELPLETIRPKSRTYDPEKTREFIKKQKLRRKEKLLEEEQQKQQKEFERKNKLEELKRKTLQLVTKNLKKTPSKSAKCSSDVNTKNTVTPNAQVDNKTVNKFLIQSRCRARSFDLAKRAKETDHKRSRSVSREVNSKQTDHKIPEIRSLVGTKSQIILQSSSQKSLTPKISKKPLQRKEIIKIDITDKIDKTNKIDKTDKIDITDKTDKINKIDSPSKISDTSLSTKENIKTESPPNITISNNKTSNKEKLSEPTKTNEVFETNAAKELTEIKQKLETSITQLKEKNEIPIWLQPPSSVPYPYNFISAVRKKLEYVTRKPNKIENTDKNNGNNQLNVSIQCSIDKKILDINSVNIPKLKSPKKSESPRTRTYESHKCRRQLYPNIDIPQLQPQPQPQPSQIKTNEIEININKTDSDSDTTKNIPELPHEETAHPGKKFEEDISDRLKNITFERNIPPKLNIGDIKLPEPEKYAGLVVPGDKIEIPKQRKSRSKYPEDIDSILSHYSKIKSENSYSDDFNSMSGSASSKPEENITSKTSKTESNTEYKQIPSGFVSLSKSGIISEHIPHTYSHLHSHSHSHSNSHSNSSSKENIFEENTKKTNSKSRVSTETNLTMQDVPSLSKQTDSIVELATIKTESNPHQIKTESSANSSFNNLEPQETVEVPQVKKLTKPEVVLKRRAEEIENNPNHIHLKLQAEVHLLNSFNNSLKQVVAVEKSLFDVPSTSHFNPVNCKRGCDFPENGNNTKIKNISNPTSLKSFKYNHGDNININSDVDDDDESVCSKDLGLSNIIDRSSISTTVATNSVISRREENSDFKSHPYVAISLDMVDQMIKDEDIRLEHLKAVLKLRDQALFDRIKGELALLEIRKRELREHGQTNDITAIKKKQRGLIIKLQQERHEMHRLKTAHKQAAKARKSALHEQKSIIKTQLSSTDQIPKKLRRLSHLERPSLGPVKVYRVDSRTEVSETTLSRKGSDDSVTNSSVLTQISEKISLHKSEIFYSDSLAVESATKTRQPSAQSEKLKRSLLMKEAEIDKRRKEIEELIKWQKRLKQKEAEVVELERQAVKSFQLDDQEKVRVFSGAHLNKVWKGIALPDKNFDEQKKYQMSKRSLDKFYQNARKMFKEVSDEEKRSKTESYSSEFEQTNLSNSVASLNEVEVQTKMVADRLRHLSDIISVPLPDDRKSNTSSEDISSIQDDKDKSVSVNSSVSVSESPSVKTEVNTLVKSDSKNESIHSEFIDSLQNKSITKSLELIIASENSARKLDESTSNSSQKSINTSAEIFDNSSPSVTEEKAHSRSIQSNIVSEIPEASEKFEPQILDSSVKSETSGPQENIISENLTSRSIPEAPEKSEPQVLETIISGNTSTKSDSDLELIPEATDKSEHQIEEGISDPEASIKSESHVPETIDSPISSVKSDAPKSITEKSENTGSVKSDSIPKSVPDDSEIPVQENIESINSSAKSITELDETSEKSKHPIQENIDSSDKSETDTPEVQENSFECPEKSTTEPEESNKIESWEPQIISETKSDSSENKIEDTVKSEIEANSGIAEKSINTQSIVESKIFDEPETKSKTTSDTHITTPRSEFQYETDFDKCSESDQSKIETESNVSLKETNVDSSINEDEPEASSTTVKASPEDLESKIIISDKSESEEILEDDSKKGVSHIDVRKRVSEILADANGPRGDKSPRVQDLYTTTYDIPGSAESTPESASPTNEFTKQEKGPSFSPETPYINEAEELLRKQLEIEQEIKRLERQQQNIPYLFMREIPNKPPPPYKPPDFPLSPVIASIIPSKPEQTKKLINDATDVLFSAYTSGDLAKTSSGTKDDQQRFMFDLCKEIAIEACKPTIETKMPSWRREKNQFRNLFAKRPVTKDRLNNVLNKRVLQLLNFEPVARNDSLIIRWSRKKRDHVDEILVSETQAEEAEWTNFDSDEEIIKDNLTQSILDLLIVEAAKDVDAILKKKKKIATKKSERMSWSDC